VVDLDSALHIACVLSYSDAALMGRERGRLFEPMAGWAAFGAMRLCVPSAVIQLLFSKRFAPRRHLP